MRTATSRAARLVTGLPDRRARIEERTIDLPGRRLTLRVHRPGNAGPRLSLVLSFHGGGFVAGAPAQNDWLNSRLAARCPAVVVSVGYRLAPGQPLPAPVEDGYDTLVRLTGYPSIAANAGSPGLSPAQLRTYRRLSVPASLDARSVSPLRFDSLAGLPPALVVTGALDPVADHGRREILAFLRGRLHPA
ncbi:alpha/beta hydrolase [Couchioplanes azureus]|uniref:alpha/beta hydrolase n=1 Tax=Couchioplanes caeruleus TaxID=56438 RepID=UPI0019BBADC0|nr:alpha/beta hydrolase fold domain-containing protein [Couchioplanes caeruleus]GGQ54154.1 hypothetical protein GCM10010166_23830 [Couchioplanes caeruleus subsp. azureus]